jgi:ribosomal protein S18 acetylase RimI-like enzyme
MAQLPPIKMTRVLSMSAENNVSDLLNALSDEVNQLYGYIKIPGDNFGEPAINFGPCGPFANTFLKLWNQKFSEKVHIVFIMVKNSHECWHVLLHLPNRLLYDGGHGIHSEEKYSDKFDIVDMIEYDIELLEKHAYGLTRTYPRFCPNFSIHTIETIIRKYLNLIQKNITFKLVTPEHLLLGSVISTSIGSPTTEKIAQVLQSYKQPNQFLIGAFASENLIAVIGFELKGTQALIKHISVSDNFKRQGIGNCLIRKIIKDHALSCVFLETDDESVGFYKKLGFKCEPFDSEYGNRYRCHLDLLQS